MFIGPASFRVLLCAITLALVFAAAPSSLLAQAPSSPPPAAAPVVTGGMLASPTFDLEIFARDAHGNVLETTAVVRVTSTRLKYDATLSTQSLSPARFTGILVGEYDVEVTCPGFRKATEHLEMELGYAGVPIYIYLVPESDPGKPVASTPAFILPQKLRPEMQRGMEALRKAHYRAAEKTFTKLLPKSHDNPDVLYNLGIAELGLQHTDLARSDFQHTLSVDPNHELALASLGHLELNNGAPAAAIPLLEKAVSSGRVGWRADFDLATAYMKLNRLSDAESEASRAARFARDQAAGPTYLLGQIQYAEGKQADAKRTWESIPKTFPSTPLAAQARAALAQTESADGSDPASIVASLPVPAVRQPTPLTIAEHPWAPPDIDSAVPDVAPYVTCKTDAVLDAAFSRMKSQLLDFEKFTATEHIEHQDIDRYGLPGPMKSQDFSYIVFVYPLGSNSFYVQESRDGSTTLSGFADDITTTSLNALGVNVLQPFYRDRFTFSCEGLANLRGRAAWQVHFEQKPNATDGIRDWKTNKKTYDIPIKGRIWVSASDFSVLRIETDLRQPVQDLQLTRDHFLVDYGLVDFAAGSEQLWLPWSADMYVELHGKRYHHKHSLTNYLLFAVDTREKIGKPKEPPQ